MVQLYLGTTVLAITTVHVQRYSSFAIKYDGTSVRRYSSMTVYSSTTVPKYDVTSTTVQVRRHCIVAKRTKSTTILRYDGTSTTVLKRRYFTVAKKYDGTKVYDCNICSVAYNYGEKYDGTVVRLYTIQVRRYFTVAKSTTVPEYDSTVVLHIWQKVRLYCSTTVQVRRYKYNGTSTTVFHFCKKYYSTKVRRYCTVAKRTKSTTVL